jgi:hypothetical protein
MAGEDTGQLYTPAHHDGVLDKRLNSTNYIHPQETNLLNLAKAMEYNTQGQPVIRTTSGASPASNDAFGRLRVSNPLTLFDSFHRYNDNGKISTYTNGDATATFDDNAGLINCTVGTASGDAVYRESNRVFAYQPGKSLQILTTFVMSPAKTNLRQRIGYFDTNNGVFLEQDGTALKFRIRSYVTGSIVYETANQADWNVDPLDGTGESGVVLDMTKAQILFFDIEWLGVGSVRCGFVINGQFILAHVFQHANIISSTYMTTACLPVRMEIENTGITTSSSTYKQICSTVISEGGYALTGRPLSIGHGLNAPYVLSNPNTVYPIFSMRLKSTRMGAIVLPKNYSVGLTGNNNFRFMIIIGGTTAGGTWVDAGTSSSVEYNLTATSITGGRIAEWKQIIGSNQFAGVADVADPFAYQLERNTFTSTPMELTICLTTNGNNVNVYGAVNWEEVT